MSPNAAADPAVDQVCRLKASLRLPRPWNISAFAEQVADVVGKPIRLVPQQGLTARGFPCGLVVERVDDIVVAYDSTSSAYHTDHIVLHEFAHLLLAHTATDRNVSALGNLLPELNGDSVLRVLARTDYDDVQENQAELFASLVMADIVPAARRPSVLRGVILSG